MQLGADIQSKVLQTKCSYWSKFNSRQTRPRPRVKARSGSMSVRTRMSKAETSNTVFHFSSQKFIRSSSRDLFPRQKVNEPVSRLLSWKARALKCREDRFRFQSFKKIRQFTLNVKRWHLFDL